MSRPAAQETAVVYSSTASVMPEKAAQRRYSAPSSHRLRSLRGTSRYPRKTSAKNRKKSREVGCMVFIPFSTPSIQYLFEANKAPRHVPRGTMAGQSAWFLPSLQRRKRRNSNKNRHGPKTMPVWGKMGDGNGNVKNGGVCTGVAGGFGGNPPTVRPSRIPRRGQGARPAAPTERVFP